MSNKLAIIGGTGMNTWDALETQERTAMVTDYGAASAPVVHGRINGCEVFFLARHGEGHKIPPHAINYRANIKALAQLGVTHIIAIAAVGGMDKAFAPGDVCVPHDLIDYTWGRAHTYSDGSPGAPLEHVEMGTPYASSIRDALLAGADASQISCLKAGVVAVTQGPRLETPAEIQRYMRDGATMVGMTGMPEAALAAELGLEYACLAVSVNWAAGLSPAGAGIHDEIAQSIATGMQKVQAILLKAIPILVNQ